MTLENAIEYIRKNVDDTLRVGFDVDDDGDKRIKCWFVDSHNSHFNIFSLYCYDGGFMVYFSDSESLGVGVGGGVCESEFDKVLIKALRMALKLA